MSRVCWYSPTPAPLAPTSTRLWPGIEADVGVEAVLRGPGVGVERAAEREAGAQPDAGPDEPAAATSVMPPAHAG